MVRYTTSARARPIVDCRQDRQNHVPPELVYCWKAVQKIRLPQEYHQPCGAHRSCLGQAQAHCMCCTILFHSREAGGYSVDFLRVLAQYGGLCACGRTDRGDHRRGGILQAHTAHKAWQRDRKTQINTSIERTTIANRRHRYFYDCAEIVYYSMILFSVE